MKSNIKNLSVILASLAFFSASAFAERGDGERPGRGGPPDFSVVDLDGDGVLTLVEFMSEDIPHGDHEEIYTNIDSDSDGQITELEWTSHRPPQRGGRE